jgi:hypothetical protein
MLACREESLPANRAMLTREAGLFCSSRILPRIWNIESFWPKAAKEKESTVSMRQQCFMSK